MAIETYLCRSVPLTCSQCDDEFLANGYQIVDLPLCQECGVAMGREVMASISDQILDSEFLYDAR